MSSLGWEGGRGQSKSEKALLRGGGPKRPKIGMMSLKCNPSSVLLIGTNGSHMFEFLYVFLSCYIGFVVDNLAKC